MCGAIDHNGQWVIGPQFKDVQLLEEGILCESPGVGILYNYVGDILNPHIIEDVYRLSLKGNPIDAYKYEINERFGLMDLDGRRLTDALYLNVWAITENLFGGVLSDGKSSVVINRKGEVVKQHPSSNND